MMRHFYDKSSSVKGPNDDLIGIRSNVEIRMSYGMARFISFNGLRDAKEHFALVFSTNRDASELKTPLVRVHSECITGDLFGSAQCDCGSQLKEALSRCSTEGGVVIYLRQEGRGIGLYNKLDAYLLQQQGLDTFSANEQLGLPADDRDFSIAGDMLKALGVTTIRLLTNNPFKIQALLNSGIMVEDVIPTGVYLTPENRCYLTNKVQVSKHNLKLETADEGN